MLFLARNINLNFIFSPVVPECICYKFIYLFVNKYTIITEATILINNENSNHDN